jgi:GntR family transcriptional repressor for pyruvate dehydrogenase complex
MAQKPYPSERIERIEPYSAGLRGSAPLQVADSLREIILGSADGELLGGENELIARFGVSRPTFRQAARILQAEGLLVVRRGVNGGLFAQPPSTVSVARSVSVLLRHHGVTFRDLTDAIQALAGEMARQAAVHRSKAARARLARRLRSFVPAENATDSEQVFTASLHLGECLEMLAPNPVVSELLQVLVELLVQQPDRPSGDGRYPEVRTFHDAVADAIAAGEELTVLQLFSDFRVQLDRW